MLRSWDPVLEKWRDWAMDFISSRTPDEQLIMIERYSPELLAGIIEKYPGIRKRLDSFLDMMHDHPAPDGLKTALFFAFFYTTQSQPEDKGMKDEATNGVTGVELGSRD
jgi:hypothetical protein